MDRKLLVILLLWITCVLRIALGPQEGRAAPTGPHEDLGVEVHSEDRAYTARQLLQRNSANYQFAFAVTSDMRMYCGPGTFDTPQFFRGANEAINSVGGGAFMISPGDIDPPSDVQWTINQYLGEDYLWYPVVGNHETETPEDMEWLRAYDYDPNGDDPPHIVNLGPGACEETTYSFDYGNSHFVVLNEYCDATSDTGTDGDVVDALYNWLVDDLNATDKMNVFVFGHEPAYPQPDADNGRERHMLDSLNQHPTNRDRFWNLLKDKDVVAYICGHTHNYSATEIGGLWQLDAGHSRGMGDTGARSTFILVHVDYGFITFETYRDDASGGAYTLRDSGVLKGSRIYLPLAMRVAADAASLAQSANMN